jgi:hypothetical protein
MKKGFGGNKKGENIKLASFVQKILIRNLQ